MTLIAKDRSPRSHISLGYDTWTGYEVSTRLDISSQAHAYKLLDDNCSWIEIYSDLDIYINFDNSVSDSINTQNDLIAPAGTIYSRRVPRGLGEGIYVHFKATSSEAGKYIRLVQC